MSTTLSDQLHIWGFEDQLTLFSDGSLGFGLALSPLSISSSSDEEVNTLASRLGQFLNGLPSNIDIQFLQDVHGGNADILKRHQELSSTDSSETARALVQARVDRLSQLDDQGKLPKHSLKVFVRRPFSKSLIRKPSLFSKTRLFPSSIQETLGAEVAATNLVRDDILNAFQRLGFSPVGMSPEDVARAIYKQWNPCRLIDLSGYDPEDIRSSLLFTDVSLGERGFSLSDAHHRVLSLKLMPEITFSGMASRLSELPFDSKLFLSIHVPDQQKELAHLQTQRRLAFAMVHGKKSGVSDLESEAKFQDVETILSELIAQGEKIFHVSFNVVLRARSEAELDAQAAQTLALVRSLSGAEAMEETLAAFDIFSQSSIPNARCSERTKRMKTTTLADFLPVYGPWSDERSPALLLRSRLGGLVGLDPFSQEFTNYNHVVSGGSGSGKSFLTNILLLQMLKENPKVFIVDIGGSYKKLAENLEGQYIPLGVESGLSINPFDLLPGESTPSSQKIKFLVGLVELMTKEEGAERLPRLERAEIEEAVCKTYESGETPTLSVLRSILLKHEDVTIRRYGRILTPWCGNSAFGKMVDRPTSVEFSKRLVVFDLKGLETAPDLQSVCLYIITDLVWREVQRDRSSKKFLVFDECWKLLENDAGSSFIAEVFRTFRKYFASAIAISQNMDDFAKSKVSGAILSNSSLKWCLTQKGSDQARLKEVLQLNDKEMGLIASLHQERGVYSEAYLMAQDRKAVVAIDSTPLEYWIATTDPRDLAALDSESKSQDSTLHVLQQLAEKYPRGVAASERASQ